MANPFAAVWRALVGALSRMFSRPTAVRALPPGERDPAPGTRDFLRHPSDGDDVSDPRADAWIAGLRAALPFPQPAYGSVEAPATPREVHERMSALDAEIAAQVARAVE